MAIVFGVAILVAVVAVLLIRSARHPVESLHTVVDTCTRCGCVRTTVVTDPAFADRSIMSGRGDVRSRTYTYPPSFAECRTVGHDWPQR